MQNIESTGKNLIDHICRTIAVNEPFSMEEIAAAYNRYNSIDKLIEIIELAKEQKTSLLDVTEKQTDKNLTMKGSICLGFNVGPETKK